MKQTIERQIVECNAALACRDTDTQYITLETTYKQHQDEIRNNSLDYYLYMGENNPVQTKYYLKLLCEKLKIELKRMEAAERADQHFNPNFDIYIDRIQALGLDKKSKVEAIGCIKNLAAIFTRNKQQPNNPTHEIVQ